MQTTSQWAVIFSIDDKLKLFATLSLTQAILMLHWYDQISNIIPTKTEDSCAFVKTIIAP